VADWGEANMGSPRTLVDFVTWARAAYPAQRYALIFWDHGWGWWPGNTMQDVTSNDYLDMHELRRALETVGGVDMAGMETCLGQTIEVQAEFRGFAKALAGSEDSTGYTTFYYPEILRALQSRPTMGASELAVVAAKSIRTGHDKWSLTGSAVALDWRWDRLAQAVSDLGWSLGSGIKKYRAPLGAARRGTASPPQSYPEVRDLYDMAAEIKAHVTSPTVRKECDLVMKWSRRCTLYEWSPTTEGAMHGTAIFWPAGPRRNAVFSQWVNFPYYASQLTFTRLTYWADFLQAWGG
ncbi:MAG TPA: clostripain-related cysteine peptidase, partial [Thermoleophilia bacterium]